MKTAVLASFLASAAAFAPASNNGRSATMLFEDAAAAEPEAKYVASESLPFMEYPPNLKGYVGDAGFDPFRFSDFLPMDFLREAELKHGRICMMATAGFAAVDLGLRVYPLPEGYEGLTSVTAHDALVKQGGMGQMLLWFSFLEIFDTVAVIQMLNGSGRRPGDFGFDPAGFLKNADAKKEEDMMLKELTNGRLAMLAFSGMVTQAVLTQGPFPYV
ncbi:protein fucoxanthin chlorophyll a/c protein [Phaeodactylum tricornutum CCAP 1055/1]|uniref:Protein fucoxanthin chlorophyll a/c protein n=2 Tax=Phaeodactylum tricornutum TaxID=2850 RepID=B7FQE1_PHATC|nr:protein fucoxanthin chlorophyll a/c protein [Phaeodactylum tricornutum CCAP 1055/1]EEC51848.1 protein fucoxanthin chlorophyll a/c protein [Phaeodactylum tricornutum CCAP 1055/1]|eukprot:XP_002177385.1 protein fucoxanthin chlorophyll a/c protein [Phaeodactylum tricornutum CCAP 1055/1]